MNKQKAIKIIEYASEGASVYEAVYTARVLNMTLVLQAYEELKKHFNNYEINNKLFLK